MSGDFENYFNQINTFLKLSGLSIDKKDIDRTVLERLKVHWKCCRSLFIISLAIFLQSVWLAKDLAIVKSFLEVTVLLPCLTMCLLGNFRLFSLFYNIHHINYIIESLRELDSKCKNEKLKRTWLDFLQNILTLIKYMCVFGLTGFLSDPFIIMASYYSSSGEIKLMLPFICWYPFDAFVLHVWPFAYIHQSWSAFAALSSVVGPDCLFITCCTFIHLQFLYLQNDFKDTVRESVWGIEASNSDFKKEFVQLVHRHKELIRCVEILDSVYSKPTLFNVITGSLMICIAGFNAMFLDDVVLILPMIILFVFGILQVYLYCYYGDCVMRSIFASCRVGVTLFLVSMEVGDALYHSRWYDMGITERKDIITILLRSQKPCRFTAYGFADINLTTFTRIISRSWSYFALLNTMYGA